ncbi:UDP-N-acetylmuramoyl-L-alanine--D-glutamate ligase [Helicobacter monodelphidis]|uniref:UDP-N-acetylmuramoyl-L-alanine--D-glutamate ligase n=1 Tax=Helicobacter sp. 15-1451 TaxID=2004995 RepID=UPI000DCEAA14|nr:UDP-N-acetylmuramoyl-L-alanine--D-glutamate ligase [Helicobacter sp. 15-1451]RAX57992.1 UDP-N-acetylmuramoyl-L-alanine--D-glutamate ligase [Helicobacter sp. 15-1451]
MNISIFGYGTTTKPLAKQLAPVKIFDDTFKAITQDENGNLLCPAKTFQPEKSDLEITSPGISPTNPLILQARNLISEYDYFADVMPFSIWISGSNGKTTTTEMTQALFSQKGSVMGGNIGIPLALLDKNAPIWVLETSSFTLHYTQKASPNLYLLLPITQDHISWHHSFEAYQNAKLKPLLSMKQGEIALIPSELKTHPFIQKSYCETIFYDNTQHLASLFDIQLTQIPFKEPFLCDATLSLAAYKIIFDNLPYERLHTFKIGKHKLEEHFDSSNRLWVSDSKATNVDATLKALECYQNLFIHLILGGDDKGANLIPLFERMQNLNIRLYLIGSNAKRLESLARQYRLDFVLCFELKQAVQNIQQTLKSSQEVALLSPAAASLDQFSSYKQRGEEFFKYSQAIV